METELTAWLRKQIDEDEQVARRAGGDRWDGNDGGIYRENDNIPIAAGPYEYLDEDAAAHIARQDPARVLAEVDAKRRILDLHSPYPQPQVMVYGEILACGMCGSVDDSPEEWPCGTVKLLALPYADRAGWCEEWRL